ncbi:hypothetical protein ACINK0_11325 [Deinococcus sp. VB343]|uniref:hypothetical protein n=1 Tax=Deinococcus sp. VB343 TaxID=3385567 RepID=UPI0039C97420
MTQTTPTRDEVTLLGRGGLTITLFAPRRDGGTLQADALYVNASIPRNRIFRVGKTKFRVPAIPGPAFHIAHVAFPEVE